MSAKKADAKADTSAHTSFSYNIAAIFFAGFTPALMTWAIQYTTLATGLYVVLAALVALATIPTFMKLLDEQESHAHFPLT